MGSGGDGETEEAAAPPEIPAGWLSIFISEPSRKRLIPDIGKNAEEGQVLEKKIDLAPIMEDIKVNGKFSDFEPIKKELTKVAADLDQIMLIYDEDDVYGKNGNFLVISTKAAIEAHEEEAAAKIRAEEERIAAEQAAIAAAEEEKRLKKLMKRQPRKPKVWVPMGGSDLEISEASVFPGREPIRMTISRKRREFGGAYKFSDKDSQELWNSATMEFRPFKDPNHDLKRAEHDVGVQAIPETCEMAVQATANPSRNGSSQYEPRFMAEEEAKEAQRAPALSDFLRRINATCEEALQQNECFDIFENQFTSLADDDNAPGQKSDNVITEFQSFTDLTYSKGKMVSCIDWLTSQTGVVAVSCCQPLSFDERIEVSGRVYTSAILVWNFVDPIHPQYVMEAPWDVTAFKFNPTQQNLVAGGLINGQVIIWDTTSVEEGLKKKDKKGDEDGEKQIPVVTHKYLSVIESGHTAPITDLVWMQGNKEVDKKSTVTETKGMTNQFVTCATDGKVLFWDIRVKKDLKKNEILWTPTYAIELNRVEVAGSLTGMRFSFTPNGADKKFYITSMDGEVAYADFDKPEGVDHPDYAQMINDAHSGAVAALERSPFFPNILLSCGDWSFKIWKEGLNTPIFSSPFRSSYIVTGCWSPGRPGVLFIALQDGTVEVWDLLDRSHEPSMPPKQVSSDPITAMRFYPLGTTNQLLAVGDNQGVLHIMEMPKNLRKMAPNEEALMRNFFDRELSRVDYVDQRAGVRALELKDKEAAGAAKDAAGKEGGAEEEERAAEEEEEPAPPEEDMQKAEEEYRKLEKEFKIQLGLETE